jgi:hypothetical protein
LGRHRGAHRIPVVLRLVTSISVQLLSAALSSDPSRTSFPRCIAGEPTLLPLRGDGILAHGSGLYPQTSEDSRNVAMFLSLNQEPFLEPRTRNLWNRKGWRLKNI